MATKNAEPDEPMFVLLARDPTASKRDRELLRLYERRCADERDRWRRETRPTPPINQNGRNVNMDRRLLNGIAAGAFAAGAS